MGLSKSFKKIAKAVVNPVGAGIEKLTGLKQEDQLKIGAGLGAGLFGLSRVRGVMGAAGTAGTPYGPLTAQDAAAIDAGTLSRGSNGLFSSFNPWSLAAPVIGASADIWSANKYASGQQEANAASLHSAREQMAFQEHMSSTAHQRQVEDLRAAGLNPVLSANSGAPMAAGSSYEADNAAPDYRSIVPKGIDTAMNLAQMKKDFEKADSQIYLNVAAADREEQNARVARNSARRVAAEADVSEMARNYLKQNPRLFNAGQWIKLMSPFASSAAQIGSIGR